MSETPHEGSEPFDVTFERIRDGSVSEIRRVVDNDRYRVRVEPINAGEDYAAFNEALQDFDDLQSDLRVVPHMDVIALAEHTDESRSRIGATAESKTYEAIFHIAERVHGEDFVDQDRVNVAIPPEAAAKLVDGIFSYFSNAYERKLPHIYEIRPNQFMYGTIENDRTPKIYMVDLDYALLKDTYASDVLGGIRFCAEYLREYTPDPIFVPIVQQMLEFLYTPKMLKWAKEAGYEDHVGELGSGLLEYVDMLREL